MTTVDFGSYKRIVQYFYDPTPKNNDMSKSPIWCLGQQHVAESKPTEASSIRNTQNESFAASDFDTRSSKQTETPPESLESSVDSNLAYGETAAGSEDQGGWPVSFLDDFESKIWLTYRSNFLPIARSQDPNAASSMTFAVRIRSQLGDRGGFTSDTGFGCMIRSGQSLLANAILNLRLGREWRRGSSEHTEREILSLFADDPKAQYSIHRFVEYGASACGKHPGEWFGPSATAFCIQELTNSEESSSLRVYITGDGSDVYEDAFMKIAKPDGKTFKPTLVLVGTRLGIDKVTPAYYEGLAVSLQMPQSVGIAGGRPSASHYFVGVQGPNFFYLDPHQTKPALPLRQNVDDYTEAEVDSCHTRRLRLINVKEMDPSMLIGFLIRDEDDWQNWRSNVSCAQGKPIVHIADRDPLASGVTGERDGAIDEVESFDDEDEDGADATILTA